MHPESSHRRTTPAAPRRSVMRRIPRAAGTIRRMDVLLPAGWPRPKGYSNGLRVPAGHDLVVVAGMVGWDASELLVSGEFVAQFEQALRNVVAVLNAGGAKPEHLVRLTVYVTSLSDYRDGLAGVGEAWRRVMGRVYPCMALVEVKGRLEPGARVEIEATAAVPAGPAAL